MVTRPGLYQASCNAGELDPRLHGNWGLKQYYSGLAAARNVMPVPQSGFDLMPRTRLMADLGPASGNARLKRFTVARDAAYVAVIAAGQTTLFKAGVQVGQVANPYSSADVPDVKWLQRRETAFLFHPNYAPRRLLRGGTDVAWSTDTAPFINLPLVDYGGAYTNTNEQWTVRLQWTSGVTIAGKSFTVSVDGEATSAIGIPAGPDWAATGTAMKAAIEALAGVDDGITVTVGAGTSQSQEYTVTFAGGRNSGQTFNVSGTFPLEPNAALTTARTVKGTIGGEAVMSAMRGWPRTGAFFQDRLLMGGFRSKPSAWAASRTGEYFDFNTDLAQDAGAMLINLDADGGEAISHLVNSAYLGFFTGEAMYHLTDRVLKRTQPPNLMRAPEAIGASERVTPIVQGGSVLYVNREQTIVMSATYDAVSTSFQSSPLSILSSHLIDQIRAADIEQPSSATDAARYWLVRDDGVVILACLIRNQDIQPFQRWETDGQVVDLCVDGANRVFLLVDRVVGGVTRRFLEMLEEPLLFDAAVTQVFGSPVSVVSGLSAHEGRTVWAEADGWITGPFIVAGGQITLPFAAGTVTVGRWTPPIAITLPLPRDIGGRQVLKRPARVHTVQMSLIDTTSLAVGANGQPVRDVALTRAGDAVDVPFGGYDGNLSVTGLTGFSIEGQVTITQVRPGRLSVRDLTLQARI